MRILLGLAIHIVPVHFESMQAVSEKRSRRWEPIHDAALGVVTRVGWSNLRLVVRLGLVLDACRSVV